MGCTNEKPCMTPVLRWVHSAACRHCTDASARVEALRRGLEQMRADGLDIDDATTAPVWTGKVHGAEGRLLFDLATDARLRQERDAAIEWIDEIIHGFEMLDLDDDDDHEQLESLISRACSFLAATKGGG